MVNELDIEDDHLLFDKKEVVTIVKVTGSSRANDGTVTETKSSTNAFNCLRREITTRESIDSGGRLLSSDVFWEVWTEELPIDFIIAKQMVIVPDADLTEQWEVLGVDFSTLLSRFRCHCRK